MSTPETPVAEPTAKTGNTVGLVAIILAGFGFVLAVIPPTSFIAWVPLFGAFILSIIGLTRKGQKKGTSIAALIVSVVGWIVAIIVATATALVGAGTAIDEAIKDSTKAPVSVEEAEDPEASFAGIGEVVVSEDDIEFTVNSVECGETSVKDGYFEEEASGEFCAVTFSILNGDNESISITTSSVEGYIGEAIYEAETLVGHLGEDTGITELNPGLGIDGLVYIDVPAGSGLDFVGFTPDLFGFADPLVVKVS